MLTAVAGEMGGTYDGCEGTVTYPFIYTDCEGNTHTWTYTYTIEYEDFTIPADAGSTVACHADAVMPDAPVVYDNCGEMLTAVAGEMGGTYDGCEGTVTYPFTYTDCEGNTHTWTYTYTIEYEDFMMPADTGSTLECYACTMIPEPPEVYDNCGMLLTPVAEEVETTYHGCEGTVTYPFTYTDCEGNTHTWTYTYTIEYEDFMMPDDLGSTVACYADAATPTPPEVYDNCGMPLTPVLGEAGGTYDGCEGTVTYPFTYTDCEGNTHTWTYTYTIEYEDFMMPDDMGSTVACYADAVTPTPPEVYDNCGEMLTAVPGETGGTYDGCEGTVTYPFTYTDCEGNTHTWMYTYTIEYEDFMIPEDVGVTVDCYEDVVLPVAPILPDNCGVMMEPVLGQIGGNYDGCEGTVTYPFTYSDCEGNTHIWTYTYTIEYEDFTLPADAGSTVACHADAVMPDAPVVYDNCGEMLTAVPGEIGGTYDGCEGTVTYPFTYTDCEGNTHIWTYTYTIEYEDFMMPEDMGSTVACYADAVTPTPPEVYDNCGEMLTAVPGETGGTYDGCEGTVTYPFTYTDCEGNTHIWTYSYTIEYEDFMMPADTGSTLECYACTMIPEPPEVYDNCGMLLTPVAEEVETTYHGCEGTVTYPFTYTDCEGNTHTWTYTYTIEYEDFTMPADAGSTVACHADAVMPDAPVVYDNCGEMLTAVPGEMGGTYDGCEGTVTYPFTYTDCEGNTHIWTYTYTIEYEDFLMPDDMESTVACHADAVTPTPPEVYDNCGEMLTAVPGEMGGTYDGCEGTVTYPFTYTDCEGNTHIWTYTYTIEYEDFTIPADAGSTVACHADAVMPDA